jgi:hypothetical protein
MAIKLPQSIENYFAADRNGGPDAVAASFTENAVVKDEGRTHVGLDAIRKWKAGSTQKYSYMVEPFSVETENGRTVVTSHLVGDFPGSPVDLRYFFVLADAKIAELEITI